MNAIKLSSRITAHVPADLAEAVRATADARQISAADYVRGAVQARLLLDDVSISHLPNLQRGAPQRARMRKI